MPINHKNLTFLSRFYLFKDCVSGQILQKPQNIYYTGQGYKTSGRPTIGWRRPDMGHYFYTWLLHPMCDESFLMYLLLSLTLSIRFDSKSHQLYVN